MLEYQCMCEQMVLFSLGDNLYSLSSLYAHNALKLLPLCYADLNQVIWLDHALPHGPGSDVSTLSLASSQCGL